MRKLVSMGLVFAAACLILACAGGPPRPTGPEILLPGEFIESVDANVILVKCTGKGYDQPSAIFQARKACVEWVVNDQLAQTPDEKQAYQQARPQVLAQFDKYVGQPGPGAADQKGKGVKSQIRIDDYTVQVIIIVDVNKKFLTDDLVAMGVIKSKSEMLEAVGMPTMMVQPSKASKGNKYRKLVEDLVNSYLTKNKLEVLDADNVEDLNKLVGAIGEVAGTTEDEIARLAQVVGADVYIIFEIKVDKKSNGSVAYGVGISGFETTTSRKLASEMVIGPARADWVAGEEMKAFADPVNDAMGKIIPQIFDYWKEDTPRGNRFNIVLKNAPKTSDMKLGSLLKKSCTFVKTDSLGKTVKFYAQCKGDNMEIANVLDEGIKATFSSADYDFLAKNKNSIIILFK
jgi:hypothetical protein